MALKFYSELRKSVSLLPHSNSLEFAQANMVLFFCAQWCGVCRVLLSELTALLNQSEPISFPVSHWVWVDVEEAADELHSLDIETFPTLAVITQGKLRMLGPVLPEKSVWACVARSALQANSSLETAQANELLELAKRCLTPKI